jgi:hypothetical protein
MTTDVTEARSVNKPRPQARPLSTFTTGILSDTFKKQGFASAELVTNWPTIVGAEIAAHAEPIKIQWPRPADGDAPESGTLILRVEGPAAIEIQHLSRVILERVNRFFGWQAVGKIGIRQAPLRRREKKRRPTIDPGESARIAATLPAIEDEDLRQALARLGAAIKQA